MNQEEFDWFGYIAMVLLGLIFGLMSVR